MHLEITRKTAILGSSILLVIVTAGASVADTALPTTTSTRLEDGAHPVAFIKPVASANKRKRAYLAANTTATKTPPALLPAVVQADITPHHQQLADAVLRALPSGCRNHLRNFYVQYSNIKNRGLGGKTTIILAGNVTDEEFVALLTHECGHVIHSNMEGNESSGLSAFADGSAPFYTDSPATSFFAISWTKENILATKSKKADFVSGYAQSNAFEDFAETFAMYILHRSALEERARTNTALAAKLEWMNTNLPTGGNILGTSRYTWDNVVPWDVTKLPYTLTTAL